MCTFAPESEKEVNSHLDVSITITDSVTYTKVLYVFILK